MAIYSAESTPIPMVIPQVQIPWCQDWSQNGVSAESPHTDITHVRDIGDTDVTHSGITLEQPLQPVLLDLA